MVALGPRKRRKREKRKRKKRVEGKKIKKKSLLIPYSRKLSKEKTCTNWQRKLSVMAHL